MASNELLSEIKNAEEDAKKAVNEALEKKKILISKANNEAKTIIEDGNKDIIKKVSEYMISGEKKLENEKDEIIKKGLEKGENLQKKCQSNLLKAIEYLLKEFKKEIQS